MNYSNISIGNTVWFFDKSSKTAVAGTILDIQWSRWYNKPYVTLDLLSPEHGHKNVATADLYPSKRALELSHPTFAKAVAKLEE